MPLAYLVWVKISKCTVGKAFDVFTVCIIFTLMCARINCIFSGCCQGTRIPGADGARWPTREAEVILYIVMLIWFVPKVLKGKTKGELYPIYMMVYGVFRMVTETFRASDSNTFVHLAHVWALICFCIGFCVYTEQQKKKRNARR